MFREHFQSRRRAWCVISDTAVIPLPGGYIHEYLRSTYINLPRAIPVRCNTRSNIVSVFLREVSVRRQHHKIEDTSSLSRAKYRVGIFIWLFVIPLSIIWIIRSGGEVIRTMVNKFVIAIFSSNTINDRYVKNGKLMKRQISTSICSVAWRNN